MGANQSTELIAGDATNHYNETSLPKYTENKDKAKFLADRLELLVHADKCIRIESENEREFDLATVCTVDHCDAMKSIIKHALACKTGKSCEESDCALTRELIAHWNNCRRDICLICAEVKRKLNDDMRPDFENWPIY